MRKMYGLQGLPSGYPIQPSKSKGNLSQLQPMPVQENEELLDVPEFQHRKPGITVNDEGADLSVEEVSSEFRLNHDCS